MKSVTNLFDCVKDHKTVFGYIHFSLKLGISRQKKKIFKY